MDSQTSQSLPSGQPNGTETTSATVATAAEETKETTEGTVAPEVTEAEPVGGPSRGPGGKPP
jgi:hypothetical protein